MSEQILARKAPCGKTQSLCEHSKNAAEISDFVSRYPNISRLIAYLHDLGKLSDAFQDYITNGGERGSVIHAWQGALLANELFPGGSLSAILLKEIIAFCVTAHHSHLSDGISPDGSTDFFDKLKNSGDTKYSLDEIKSKITDSEKGELTALFARALPEMDAALAQIGKVCKSKNSAFFALGLLVKYLYSCLVDADRLDAYLFSIDESFEHEPFDWVGLTAVFEENLAKLNKKGKSPQVDLPRKSVSDKCKAAAEKETGIYQLSVPTGGGKTFSSLRFALHHLKKRGKKRIIYVIPYLSIIEQTASSLRDILDLPEENDVIFEHHSNIVEPEDEKSSEIRKLTASRWDSPIIITTMVQFLESVMSSKGGTLRKFAAMADSVIIFDEIQSTPISAIHCFNEVVSFLCKILNSTIILCSATQPTLESTQRANLLLAENPMLIDCADDFRDLKRVKISAEIEMDCEAASCFILEKARENGDCLVIVNTKKSALEIHKRLKNAAADFEILHLSTSMCPAHRQQIIGRIKDCLKGKRKVICVSTQLIEAGVDISFSCAVRALAGLDSIAQAAGRCNRNGESSEPKTVYTFPLKDENLDKLTDIKSGREISGQIIRNAPSDADLLDEEIMTAFYRRYFSDKNGRMDYPTTDGETVYAMLSLNEYGKGNNEKNYGKQVSQKIIQAFHSADMNFEAIEGGTKSVVAPYGEAENLINEYRNQPKGIVTKEKIRIIKKLQKYSVSLFEWQIESLDRQGALSLLDDETGILFLQSGWYSQETGVLPEIAPEKLIT